jgi:hypothetical protein
VNGFGGLTNWSYNFVRWEVDDADSGQCLAVLGETLKKKYDLISSRENVCNAKYAPFRSQSRRLIESLSIRRLPPEAPVCTRPACQSRLRDRNET